MKASNQAMEPLFFEQADFLRRLYDAVPLPLFVVDDDVRILMMNKSAAASFGVTNAAAYLQRGGDALLCVHAEETPGGCGHSASCGECVLRRAVGEAVRGGEIHRRRTKFCRRENTVVADSHWLISTSTIDYEESTYILLALENVSEIFRLQGLLPICAWCKKVRNGEDYWQSVDMYLTEQLDIDLSHAICPECLEKNYPEFSRKKH